MEAPRFDALARTFGAGRTRRGFFGLLAALAAGGVAGGADAKKRRRRCRPACGPQQTCVDRQCTCTSGGTVCGANCCLIGQQCRDGQCVELPEPTTCIAYGEPCKGIGRACCENLVCGSGQGGENDVACYVRKTGRCTSTAECTYGTECVDGVCIAPPVCTVQLGQPCVASDICCVGSCGPTGYLNSRIPDLEQRCCVGVGASCGGDRECCQPLVPGGRSPRIPYAVSCVDRVCTMLED